VEHPRKYIYTMARNRALDQLGKIARDKQLRIQAWANITQCRNVTEELLNAKESRELISEAVASLPEKKRAIYRLSRQEGRSHQEIAREMSLSVQTVKNILTDVLKHIRAHLLRHSELLAIAFWIQAAQIIF
jgi:RNA polymerase sigma-70 factor (ECF subfamily)